MQEQSILYMCAAMCSIMSRTLLTAALCRASKTPVTAVLPSKAPFRTLHKPPKNKEKPATPSAPASSHLQDPPAGSRFEIRRHALGGTPSGHKGRTKAQQVAVAQRFAQFGESFFPDLLLRRAPAVRLYGRGRGAPTRTASSGTSRAARAEGGLRAGHGRVARQSRLPDVPCSRKSSAPSSARPTRASCRHGHAEKYSRITREADHHLPCEFSEFNCV